LGPLFKKNLQIKRQNLVLLKVYFNMNIED
jgi:hypothetical protein